MWAALLLFLGTGARVLGMALKQRREGNPRNQVSMSLDLAGDREIWNRIRHLSVKWDVTIKSLVMTALEEYMAHHPEKPDGSR